MKVVKREFQYYYYLEKVVLHYSCMPQNPPNTVSIRDAATMLSCTIDYVYKLVWGKRLPGAKRNKGGWHIPVESVQQYREDHKK
jgi:hypothetical protein